MILTEENITWHLLKRLSKETRGIQSHKYISLRPDIYVICEVAMCIWMREKYGHELLWMSQDVANLGYENFMFQGHPCICREQKKAIHIEWGKELK